MFEMMHQVSKMDLDGKELNTAGGGESKLRDW
jgi:hypothetical protein